jgi:hypothetical protein
MSGAGAARGKDVDGRDKPGHDDNDESYGRARALAPQIRLCEIDQLIAASVITAFTP